MPVSNIKAETRPQKTGSLSAEQAIASSPLSGKDLTIVVLILGLVMAAWIIDSLRKFDAINNDMHVVATMVAKDLNPNLYLQDVNYATNELYRFYTPTYRWLLGRLWQVTGEFELGLVWLTPIVLGVYLAGMFWLLRRVTKNTWVALGVTVASAAYYETMGQEIWGSGSSTLMLARTIYTATVPFLTILILDTWQTKPSWTKVIGLGFGLGVIANLHPPSGLHLTVAVVGMLALLYGFRSGWLQFWLKLGAMGLATLVGVGPTSLNYVRGTDQTDLGVVEFSTLYNIVTEWYEVPFRPAEIKFRALDLALTEPQLIVMFWVGLVVGLVGLGLYFFSLTPGVNPARQSNLQRWLWLIGGLLTVWYAFTAALFNLIILFALVVGYVIYRFQHKPISRLDDVLMGWAAVIVAQSLLGYYLIVRLWEYSELASLTVLVGEQPRAARFIYMPIFLLAGLAGLAAVHFLAQRWANKPEIQTGISVVVGLFIALSPGVSALISRRFGLGLVALAIMLGATLLLGWWVATRRPIWLTQWGAVAAIMLIALVLFGPLAPFSAPYLHLPAVNVFDPVARAPDLKFKADDLALYEWVQQQTEANALFFWCEFGPTTTLHFRLKAERGLTHHWRDLNQRTYNPGTLTKYHQQYRQFEAACRDPFTTVAAAQETGADYILVPSGMTVNFEGESCFFNERYAVFPVYPKPCPQG